MSRGLHSSTVAALNQTVVRPVNFVEALFSGGALRLWTGIESYTFNSQVYVGAGNLMSIGRVAESSNLEALGVQITLSGISSTLIAKILGELTRNRKLNIWFAVMDSELNILGQATQVFSGYMDIPSIEDSGETSIVTISAESQIIDFGRVRPDIYNDEFQRTLDPNDKSHEYLADLANKANSFKWGG